MMYQLNQKKLKVCKSKNFFSNIYLAFILILFFYTEAARKGRDLVLPTKEDDQSENYDFPSNQSNNHDLVSLDPLPQSKDKEPISRRSSEVMIAPTNHSLKSSPMTTSPDLRETNESPLLVPEEVNVTHQPPQEEVNTRRFSVIATAVSPQQVCLSCFKSFLGR